MAKPTTPDTARLANVTVMYPTLPPMPKASRPGSEKMEFSLEAVLVEGTPAYQAAKAAEDYVIQQKWGSTPPANLRRAIKDPQAPSATRADGGPARRGEVFENTDGKGKRWYLRCHSQYDFPCWKGKDKVNPTAEDHYSGGVYLVLVKFAPYASPQTGSGVTAYLQLAWKTGVGKYISTGGVDTDVAEGDDIQFDEEGDLDEMLG